MLKFVKRAAKQQELQNNRWTPRCR